MVTRNENELVIDDFNFKEFAGDVVVDGHIMSRGLVPRDYSVQPFGVNAKPFDPDEIKIIPRSEWSALIKKKQEEKSQLSDMRLRGDNGQMIKSLDQNGQGYCWAYAAVICLMLARMVAGQKYVRLSPHAIACKIKNFRDQGGWGALALDYLIKYGCPSEEFWPQKSMSRQYDNPRTWEDAAKYKCDETWMDLSAPNYDRDMSFDQVATCLLLNIPVAGDFNWWGHAIGLMDLVEVNPNLPLSNRDRWGLRLLNSWSDRWSDRGMGIIQGSKAIPDNAVACRTAKAD